MSKQQKVDHAILRIGYVAYILELDEATVLFKALTTGRAEKYEANWDSNTKAYVPKVSPVEPDTIKLEYLDEGQYALGKVVYAAEQQDKGEAQ